MGDEITPELAARGVDVGGWGEEGRAGVGSVCGVGVGGGAGFGGVAGVGVGD